MKTSLRSTMSRCAALGLLAAACGSPRPAGVTAEASQGDESTTETASAPEVSDGAATTAEMVAIPNARQPRPQLLTGGRPSPEQLVEAKAAGYAAVISLLPEDVAAQRDAAETAGLAFRSIPVEGATDLTEDNARKLGEALAKHQGAPVILHCGSGNRAGALLSLSAFYTEGLNAADALRLGQAAGLTKLEAEVQTRLQTACQAGVEGRCGE